MHICIHTKFLAAVWCGVFVCEDILFEKNICKFKLGVEGEKVEKRVLNGIMYNYRET